MIEIVITPRGATAARYFVPVNSNQCFVDGSWAETGEHCTRLYLKKDGVLIEWVSRVVDAASSSQAEGKAFLRGCELLAKHENRVGFVFSDSKVIFQSINAVCPDIHDWRII